MKMESALPLTVVSAILVLLVGRWLIGRIGFLAYYNIPEPVVGGLRCHQLNATPIGTGAELTFDMRLNTPLMLIFSTVGLGANVRTLAKGGPKLLVCSRHCYSR